MPQNDVTEAVRSLRQHLSDTQQQFAARLNLAISTVVRYELSRPPRGKLLVQFERLATEHGLDTEAAVFHNALDVELLGALGDAGGSDTAKDHEPGADTLGPENENERKLVQRLLRKVRGHSGKHYPESVTMAVRRVVAQIYAVMDLRNKAPEAVARGSIASPKLKQPLLKKRKATPEEIASALHLSLEDVKLWIILGEACQLAGRTKDYALREFFRSLPDGSMRSSELADIYGIPISVVKTVRKAQIRLGLREDQRAPEVAPTARLRSLRRNASDLESLILGDDPAVSGPPAETIMKVAKNLRNVASSKFTRVP
jgi:transcriptional regulator with XRE-family HTH domain